ncbi:hypothetical protein Tco_1444223 [Tanacetum coccineum]
MLGISILLQGGVVGWLEREIAPFKEESCSTKVVVESNDQVDERESTGEGFSTKNKDTLCEVTPLKDESYSMKVIAECNEQVDDGGIVVGCSGGLEREKQLGAVEEEVEVRWRRRCDGGGGWWRRRCGGGGGWWRRRGGGSGL